MKQEARVRLRKMFAAPALRRGRGPDCSSDPGGSPPRARLVKKKNKSLPICIFVACKKKKRKKEKAKGDMKNVAKASGKMKPIRLSCDTQGLGTHLLPAGVGERGIQSDTRLQTGLGAGARPASLQPRFQARLPGAKHPGCIRDPAPGPRDPRPVRRHPVKTTKKSSPGVIFQRVEERDTSTRCLP